jgi:hypothetical protein
VFVHPSVRPVLGLTGDGDTPQREPQPASNDDAQASDQSKKSDSDS